MTRARATDDLKQCQQDCEDALNAADAAIKQQNNLIGLQSEQIESLRFNYNTVKEALVEQQAWYRQPEIVVPVSFLLGAIVTSYVSKH